MDANHLHVSGTVHAVAQAGNVYGDVNLYSGVAVAAAAPPFEVPPAPTHFTNRDRDLALLASTHERTARRGRTGLAVVVGPGGMGKSTLASFYLHRHQEAFPDGAVYADLGAFGPAGPADPGEVLDGFLRSVGVAPEQIPAGLGARAARWRSATRARRLSVVLDDAFSAAQVRALLPGQGAHLVVVTTRMRLGGLAADGARFLTLKPLQEPEALDMLQRLVGLATDERGWAGELARLCGGLPLALCAAAAPLLLDPDLGWDVVVARLRDHRLRALATPDVEGISVSAAFDTSYAALAAPTQRVYRLLGLHPGPSLDVAAVAAMADLTPAEAEECLVALAGASLLQPEAAAGRYRLHDLIFAHARQRLEQGEEPVVREAALDRLLGYYLHTAAAADLRLNARRWHLAPVFDQASEATNPFADRYGAMAWLEAELEVIARCVRLAHDSGRHGVCWQLCEALWSVLMQRKHYATWRSTHELGLAAARASGEVRAEARMLDVLGNLALEQHRPADAHALFERAYALWEPTGHRQGLASQTEALGLAALAAGQPERAVEYFTTSLRLHEELGGDYGIVIQHRRLGEAHHAAGRHTQARTHLAKALDFLTAEAEPYRRARTLNTLAEIHLATDQPQAALAAATEALGLVQGIGAAAETARTHTLLAEAAQATGDAPTARTHLTHAHTTYTRLGLPQAETVARRLAELGQP